MNRPKMSNLGINIKINGSQICKAGFDNENFVLTTIISLVHREGGSEGRVLSVSGLDSEASEHVSWYSDLISPGDRIILEVIEGPFDPTLSPRAGVETVTDENDLQPELKRYHQLKEELKEHLEKKR